MRQSQSYAMRCTSIVHLVHLIFWMLGCGGTAEQLPPQNNTLSFTTPTELITALRQNPARTLQTLHIEPTGFEKDALILDTIEQFPHRSKPLCPILSTDTAIERCLRLTERPHLWKRQPHHFAKSTHPTSLSRTCTLDPHPNTCWTAQAILDSSQDWTLAEDACRQIQSDMWRAECFFTLAESIDVNQSTLQRALQTCSYSDQFQKSCWMHIIVHLAKESTAEINDVSWLDTTHSILDDSVVPDKMKNDLWQHFLAKSVSTAFERGVPQGDHTPTVLTGHWQNQHAIEVLRWCDVPIQNISEWIQLAQHTSTSKCTPLSEPRGMDLESDLWSPQVFPGDCVLISFFGQSHRIYCSDDDDLNWHMALLEASARLRPNNAIFVQESLRSPNVIIQKRAERLSNLNWQEKPDQRQ